jgi:hypothetical protein
MLTRRFAALALPLVLALVAQPAFAGEGEGEHKQVGQYVDLQPVGLPIVQDRQLVNYVFVNIRLNLVAGVDTPRWRAKEPFFRDALVRISHKTPFGAAGNPDAVDVPRLTAALTREAVAITGPGVIRSVVVTSQTPSKHTPHRPS